MNALPTISVADEALLALLRRLDELGYDFITPTPATHARVLARDPGPGKDLRDVLGWSRAFERGAIDADLFDLLAAANVLEPQAEGLWKSTIRVSRVRGLLFIHSAYPTEAEDSVFLGPDSYRFADFIAAELGGRTWVGRLVDIGSGAGVGALTAAVRRSGLQVVLTDVNPIALRFARLNARHAGVAVEGVQAPGLDGAPDGCDLILANPPYIVDDKGRAYRDGGDMHGAQLSLDWARAALAKLSPGGRFLLYTGAAILAGGRNRLFEELETLADETGVKLTARELDPDVFGEELETPGYRDVERIAVVGVTLTRPREGAG